MSWLQYFKFDRFVIFLKIQALENLLINSRIGMQNASQISHTGKYEHKRHPRVDFPIDHIANSLVQTLARKSNLLRWKPRTESIRWRSLVAEESAAESILAVRLRPSCQAYTSAERDMIAGNRFKSQIPESVAEATDSLQSLVARDSDVSLEELQGAIEYLLDKVKAARGPNGWAACGSASEMAQGFKARSSQDEGTLGHSLHGEAKRVSFSRVPKSKWTFDKNFLRHRRKHWT
jgi:hypothetical protein